MARGFASRANEQEPCPCGSGARLDSCCGPLHQRLSKAKTAEQLMRSRYSAFVLEEIDYLLATHPDPHTSIPQRRRQLRASCRQLQWLGLEILAVECGGIEDCRGIVQFEARFITAGTRSSLKETSLFERRDGQRSGDWTYVRAL